MGEPAPSDSIATTARPLPIPTTFGGVAELAVRPARWLGCWQILLAFGVAVVVAWALDSTWVRALQRASAALPESGGILEGRLDWKGQQPASVLVEGPFLGIVVDPAGSRGQGLTSDVTLSVEGDRFAVGSILGWEEIPYPPDLRVGLGRLEMSGAVAAWAQPALMVAGMAAFLGLLFAWQVLGAVYGVVIWIMAAPTGRAIPILVACRLAGGALLLPAVLMSAAIVLYVTREIGVAGLLVAVPIHVIAGWVYCVGAVARLPAPPPNPFHPGATSREEPVTDSTEPLAPP